jgi:hypothetical protein
MRPWIALMLGALAAYAQSTSIVNGGRSFRGEVDASQATSTVPARTGTALPATCVVGEQFFKSDAAAGANLHLCAPANTWNQVSGAGGGGDLSSEGSYEDPSWLVSLGWSKITGKPSVFAPDAHEHSISNVSGLQPALDGKEPSITAGVSSQVWLGNKVWGNVLWADIASKPSVFPPEAHNHDAAYVSLGGSYLNPNWITSLAGAKITGAVAEAQSLTANGTNCPEGQASRGVDAEGNAEGCFTPESGSAGGSAEPGSYAASLASSSAWVVDGATHGLGTCDIAVSTYAEDGSTRTAVSPSSVACEVSGDNQHRVTVAWSSPQAGRLVLVRGGPAPGKTQNYGSVFPGAVEGDVGYFPVGAACTVTEWRIKTVGGTSPTVTADIWINGNGDSKPTAENSITGSQKPAISAGDFAKSTAVSGWTTVAIAAGAEGAVRIDSVTGSPAEVHVYIRCAE